MSVSNKIRMYSLTKILSFFSDSLEGIIAGDELNGFVPGFEKYVVCTGERVAAEITQLLLEDMFQG